MTVSTATLVLESTSVHASILTEVVSVGSMHEESFSTASPFSAILIFGRIASEGIHLLSVLEMSSDPCREPDDKAGVLSLELPVLLFIEKNALSLDTSSSVSPTFSAS